jgi:glycerophosphoryl diester phosphodiesterase
MLLIAHRGHHFNAPENTLEAFEAAIGLGVGGIETDVRLSADGELVLLHDRMTPLGHPVAEAEHVELEREFGYRVPVLAAALEAFPDVLWNVEIKTPPAMGAAIAVLKRYQRSRRLLVTSFRHDLIAHHADELEVEWGLLFAHLPASTRTFTAGGDSGKRIRNAVWDYNVIEEEILRVFEQAGWRNYAYGLVTVAEHRQCAALGVAGIITDYPALV